MWVFVCSVRSVKSIWLWSVIYGTLPTVPSIALSRLSQHDAVVVRAFAVPGGAVTADTGGGVVGDLAHTGDVGGRIGDSAGSDGISGYCR